MIVTQRSSGSAIILALFVVAVVAFLASSILWRQEVWIAELGMQRDVTALRNLARTGTDWARAVLIADSRISAIDHLGESWAIRVPPTELEGGDISGFLEDEQGKWNLNNLARNGRVDPKQLEVFQRLLEILDLPTDLAFSLRDWVDSDSDPESSAGAEDEYYLSLSTPRRPANSSLAHVDELGLVRGYSPEIVARLRPFVTAVPEFAAVNVNTASREVLAAVLPGLTDVGVLRLLDRRERVPFRDMADFRGTLKESVIAWEERSLTTASQHFLATLAARQGHSSFELNCMIRRQNGRTEIIWQRYQ